MKTKIFKFAALLLIVAGSFYNCQSNDENNNEAPDVTRPEGQDGDGTTLSLMGSKWKLVGIVDPEDALQVLEPKDCEECYTLTFDTDYTAIVYSINMTRKIDLLKLGTYWIEAILFCEKWNKDGKDYCDSDVFRVALFSSYSYTVTSEELKMFYTNYGIRKYLLFKPY